jgi:GH24 family phage-related lysozyme (muramidase)
MAKKKKTYYDYLREELGELVEQLELPDLYKKSLKRRWLDQVVWADKKADQCRRWHYRLRLTTIVGGVILPALVGINLQLAQDNPFFRDWFPYVPFALSQVIAVSAALEEFYRNGDRWRDYRKMAEDLKAEGWQYLQITGPYERLENHLDGYPMFASRVESVIKNDVQSYINALQQKQAKEEQQVQQILKAANTVAEDNTLFAEPEPVYELPQTPQTPQLPQTPQTPQTSQLVANQLATAIAAPLVVNAPAGTAGSLKIKQDTEFKLSTQMAQSLPDHQKVKVGSGSTLGLLTYVQAENSHLKVTLTQGVGAENRNTWYVYAPHTEVLSANGQPINLRVAVQSTTTTTTTSTTTVNGVVTASTSTSPSTSTKISSTGEIILSVPFFSQRDNLVDPHGTCNTSSCAMAAKYLGAKISGDDEYFTYVSKHGRSVDHDAQTRALADLGIKSTWHTNLDFDDLDKSLAQGLPIVIGILHHGPLEYPTGGGHILVVIGRTAKGDYFVHDPYGDLMSDYCSQNGKKLTYSRHVLKCRWTVEGKNTGYGRLFYNNPIPGAPVQVAQANNSGNSGIPVFSVNTPQSSVPAGLTKQSSSAIPHCGIELIKKFEGYAEELPDGRAKAYADPIHGWSVPTIGYGSTEYPDGRKVKQGDIITREQAEEYLVRHVEAHCKPSLEKIPTWGQMNANQRGALYSFAYNLGAGFYGGSDFQSITRVCDATDKWNDHAWVEAQFVKYCNPGTSAEVGLRRRRMEEAKLFCT